MANRKGFLDMGVSDGRGGEMNVTDESGSAVDMSKIGGTGVHIDDKHLTTEDIAALKQTNPELHAEIQKMRGTLRGAAGVTSGASKAKVITNTSLAGGEEGEVIKDAAPLKEGTTVGEPLAPRIKPGAKLGKIHSDLDQARELLQSHIHALTPHRDAHPIIAAVLDIAGGMVDNSAKHLDRAKAAMRGDRIGDKFVTRQHEAPRHLDKAHGLLTSAQDLLDNEAMGTVRNHFKVSVGDATDALNSAGEGLGNARRRRGARPFNNVNIAGQKVPRGFLPDPNDRKKLVPITKENREALKGTLLGDKLDAADRGTQRGQRARSGRPDRAAGTGRVDTRFRGSSRIKGPEQGADTSGVRFIGPMRNAEGYKE